MRMKTHGKLDQAYSFFPSVCIKYQPQTVCFSICDKSRQNIFILSAWFTPQRNKMSKPKESFIDIVKKDLSGFEKKELLKIKANLVKFYFVERERISKYGNEAEMDKIDDKYQRKLTDINKAIFKLKLPVPPKRPQKRKL